MSRRRYACGQRAGAVGGGGQCATRQPTMTTLSSRMRHEAWAGRHGWWMALCACRDAPAGHRLLHGLDANAACQAPRLRAL